MRKIFSFMMLFCFMVVAASAQTDPITSGSVYRIVNKENAGKAISENTNCLLQCIAESETDNSQLWLAEGNSTDGYTFRNVLTGDYMYFVDAYYTKWGANDAKSKFYVGVAEEATETTPQYLYLSLKSDATPNTMAYAHYSGGDVVRWTRWDDAAGIKVVNASLWSFAEVEMTADQITTIRQEYCNSLCSEANTLLTNAGYAKTAVELTKDNTTCPAARYNAANPTGDDQGVPALLDEDPETFMHTVYDGSFGAYHYIQVDLGEDNSASFIDFSYGARHNNQVNNPETMIIQGSVDGASYTDITTLTNLPDGLITYNSPVVGNGNAYRYFRFVVTETTNNAKKSDGFVFFSMSRFRMNTHSVTNEGYKAIVVANISAFAETLTYSDEWCYYNAKDAVAELPKYIAGATVKEYPFELTTDKNAPKCYYIQPARDLNNPYYYQLRPDKSGMVQLVQGMSGNVYTHWFFMEDAETGLLQIYPFIDEENPLGYVTVGDGADKLTNVSTTTNFAGTFYELVNYSANNDATNAGYIYALKPFGVANYVSNYGGVGNLMGFYNATSGDTGTALKFVQTTTPSLLYRDVVTAIATANSACPTGSHVGTGLNAYSQASVDEYNAEIAEVETAIGVNATTLLDEDALNAFITDLGNLYNVLVINQPVNGKFYRLRCVDNGMKYLQSTLAAKSETVNRFNMIAGDAGKTVTATFCYYNNALVAYSNPLYISHENNNASYSATPLTVLFEKNNQKVLGQYNIKLGNRYMFGSNDLTDSGSDSGPDTRAGYRWWLEEVTSIPVEITAAGATTLFAPVALTIPADVIVYTATKSGEYLVLTAVDTTIPANTGVIIMGDANTYNFEVAEAVDAIEDNELQGTVATITTTANAYTLQKPADDLVMKAYNGETLKGFKAYYTMDTTAANALKLSFGEATGIETVVGAENGKLEIYDMSGRRVEKMHKGLYIVNGQKVMVK